MGFLMLELRRYFASALRIQSWKYPSIHLRAGTTGDFWPYYFPCKTHIRPYQGNHTDHLTAVIYFYRLEKNKLRAGWQDIACHLLKKNISRKYFDLLKTSVPQKESSLPQPFFFKFDTAKLKLEPIRSQCFQQKKQKCFMVTLPWNVPQPHLFPYLFIISDDEKSFISQLSVHRHGLCLNPHRCWIFPSHAENFARYQPIPKETRFIDLPV